MATRGRLHFDGDNIYTEKELRVHKLTEDVEQKIDHIPGVVNDLGSDSETDALSAKMGKVLYDQITSLSGTGKFLSAWDCTTGLPLTNPQEDPYTYKVGDYYVVSAIGTTNYKPHGGTFTQGVPSTAVETENVGVNDKYYFDGASWTRIPDTAIQVGVDSALSTTSTNAVENRVITNALNQKQGTISDLATIRSGAAAGATALQSGANITELTNNAGYQTAGDVASLADGIIHSGTTAPTNPTEGQLWYDTTNDVLKVYDGSSWSAVGDDATNINTKTFYLSSRSDLTNAQAAYDWYLSGKNPIINMDDRAYILTQTGADSSALHFHNANIYSLDSRTDGFSNSAQGGIKFTISNGIVVNITTPTRANIHYLSVDYDYPTPYIPQYDGSPATKKYVDDSISSSMSSSSTAPSNPVEGQLWYDTTNDQLKVYDGTNWNLTGKVYSSGTGISVDNTNDTISNTGVLSVNGNAGAITGIATESYVDSAVDESIHSGSTAPSNPETGTLWYDTTNSVLKVYDGSSWSVVGDDTTNINTKTFPISGYGSSVTVLAEAQLAYDWFKSGKNPILKYQTSYGVYTLGLIETNKLTFYRQCIDAQQQYGNAGKSHFYQAAIVFNISGGNVTSVQSMGPSLGLDFLATDIDYNNVYQPQYDGSPATKKYVDDSVANIDISSAVTEGASLGTFLKAMQASGTAHNVSFPSGGDTTYTFNGLGYINVEAYYGHAMTINGISMFYESFSSGTYTYKYINNIYTVGPGDVVRIWKPNYNGIISVTAVDYY